MNYSVNLVQRGISAQTHPVSGKSGKLFGNAVASPEHGGVTYLMSMQDYIDNAHDIVGNVAAGQQWVPEFLPVAPTASSARCDRCSKPAVARADRYFYCRDHAPNNAVYLDGSGTVKPEAVPAVKPEHTADTPPVVEERLSGPVEEHKELPQEHFPPPAIGTEREDGPAPKTESGVVVLKKPIPSAEKPTISFDPEEIQRRDPPNPLPVPAPTAQEKPKPAEVIAAITEGVVKAIMPKIDDIVAKRMAALQPKKSSKPRQPRPETEFSRLQKRAGELGINSFGKNTEALRQEIAAKAEIPFTE